MSNVNNMAPRRVSRTVKPPKILDYNALILKDVLCPICRSIMIEPVTLPCSHGFCSACFNGTMENANLVCPLCRIRIGSWLRKAKKEVKLINYAFWDAIKSKFPQHVKNRINGIDENLEEEPEVIVSYPGEIRKEYELQKQKEEKELQSKREADLKASENLIRKICEEDDYQRAVMEEKLKIDEKVAKKLAQELGSANPSTSKVKQAKKLGPMDKFVKQESDAAVQSIYKNNLNKFTNKEYTCKILCLDNTMESDSRKKVSSLIIPRKIQQLQKIAEADITSDSSDCIELELRYFKPIDYRGNPPSEGKPAIRVPTKKLHKNATARILSPTGLINFHSNFLESAFARISFPKSSVDANTKDMSVHNSSTDNSKKLNISDNSSSRRKMKRKVSNEEIEEEFPTLTNFRKIYPKKRHLHKQVNNTLKEVSESPPFLGFENNSESKDKNSNITNNKNGLSDTVEDEKSKKLLQEMEDLEYAKKLQDELNRNVHYTRSSRRTRGNTKRQTTLDELMRTRYTVK